MVNMQKNAETQGEEEAAENADPEDSVKSGENADTETNSEVAVENSGQINETTDDGSDPDSDGSASYYENLPEGVPYTSGFSTPSGVASIVAAGEGDEESEFFMITETELILMISASNTVIKAGHTYPFSLARIAKETSTSIVDNACAHA